MPSHTKLIVNLTRGKALRRDEIVDRLSPRREDGPAAVTGEAPADSAAPGAGAPIAIHARRPGRIRELQELGDYEPAHEAPRGPGPIAALVTPARVDPAVSGDEDASPANRMSVLVISADRRFRSVTTVLIARRGCSVATTEHASRLVELADRIGPDVVVIDLAEGSQASAGALAQARTLARPVGIVLVDEEAAGDARPGAMRVLGKWGPFAELFAAIEAAERPRFTELRR